MAEALNRNTKLTPEVHENIVQLVKRGNFLKDAAEFCQVEYRTVRRWIVRGEAEADRLANAENEDAEPLDSERIYLDFCQAVEQAKAYANVFDQNVIGQAAHNDPKWALERLRLRNPAWFKQESKVEISGQVDRKVELDVIFDDETLALSHQLLKKFEKGKQRDQRALEAGSKK